MASNFRDYLADRGVLLPVFDDIARGRALTLRRRGDGSLAIDFHANRMREPANARFVIQMFASVHGSLAGGIDLYNHANLLGVGAKVFRPTAAECFALEEIEIRLPVAEYAQPFPTFAVEFPPEYTAARRMRGTGLFIGVEQQYAPVGQIVSHDPGLGLILASTITDSADETVLCGIVGDPASATMEDDLGRTLADAEPINEDETAVQKRCCRVAMNACLLLVDRGFRKAAADPAAERASKELEQAKRRGAAAEEAARTRRRVIPTEYGFVQNVNVRRAVRGDVGGSEAGDEATRRVSPHWRSAHWRMQPCGPGRSRTRRVLIPHVMVNRSRFAGEESGTLVVQS